MAVDATLDHVRYEYWQDRVKDLSAQFRSSQPFPYVQLEDFLHETSARMLHAAFPPPGEDWIQYTHFNERKQGKNRRDELPPEIIQVIDELHSERFLVWLTDLTGITDLLPDPDLDGAGLHQTVAGGFLNLHCDFATHHRHTSWRRRLNLILYLNPEWKPEWGGSLELWDKNVQTCVASILPTFNRAVIFQTDDTSYHGYPEPIRCPDDNSRKSLALYYYTQDAERATRAPATHYHSRPSDPPLKRILVRLDNGLLRVFAFLRRWTGISNETASRWLRRLGLGARKK